METEPCTVAGDDLAFQVGERLDLVLQVRPQHQVVADRRRDAVGDDGDRQALFQRVEIAGRDAAGDDLQLVLREQRDRVRRGVDVVALELDAVLL